jgi:hypothetical protein
MFFTGLVMTPKLQLWSLTIINGTITPRTQVIYHEINPKKSAFFGPKLWMISEFCNCFYFEWVEQRLITRMEMLGHHSRFAEKIGL